MKNKLFNFISLFLLFGLSFSLSAQVKGEEKLTSAQELCVILVSKIEVPEINYAPVEPPKYWFKGFQSQVGFSHVSLTNWAEGGAGSISLNSFVDAHITYAKGMMKWDNRLQLDYGFLQTFGDKFKKTNDRIYLVSKWGYKAIDKLFFSALFNFRTQFTNGYVYSGTTQKLVSQSFAPAYFSLGFGMDYNPFKSLSVNFAPLTGNLVIVTNPDLRTKYGNKADEQVRKELGAQLKTEFKKEFKNFKVGTVLTLFSNFLHNPENIQVFWDLNLGVTINKYIAVTLRTNLIYDDNIKIADSAGNLAPRAQFKEVFSLNFTYTLGNYQKAQ